MIFNVDYIKRPTVDQDPIRGSNILIVGEGDYPRDPGVNSFTLYPGPGRLGIAPQAAIYAGGEIYITDRLPAFTIAGSAFALNRARIWQGLRLGGSHCGNFVVG